MAELLVRAKKHYMDDFTQEQVDKMSSSEKLSYEARSQIGDIICVYPDGACKEEPAPDSVYVIIKLPGIKIEEAKKYEEQMQDTKEVTREMTMLKSEYDTLVKDGKLTEKATGMMSLAKVPTITSTKSVETAKGTEQEYTINATMNERYLKRVRKYQIPKNIIDNLKTENKVVSTIAEKDITTFVSNIINK